MSKSLKYVSDFQFPSECGFTGSTGKTMVKGYARGGYAEGGAKKAVANERAEMSRIKQETRSESKDAGQEMSRVRKEMRYDEAKVKAEQPTRKQYPTNRSEPMIKMMSGGMIKNRGKLGVDDNKNPGETKMHTAPNTAQPKTMMKKGGSVKKMADGGPAKATRQSPLAQIGQQAMQRGQQMNMVKPQINPRDDGVGLNMPQRGMPQYGGQQMPDKTFFKSFAENPRVDVRPSQMDMQRQMDMQGGRGTQQMNMGKPPATPGRPAQMMMAKGGMTPKQEAKMGKVINEFKSGELHSGSKSGPMVKNRKQAVAIAMSEANKKRK